MSGTIDRILGKKKDAQASEEQGATSTTPITTPDTDGTPPPTPEPKQPLSMRDIVRRVYEMKIPTKEEIERNRKRERRQKIISAVGDGISAISNLVTTSKGALNAYDPDQSLTKKYNEKWKKYHDQLDGYKEKYIQQMLAAEQYDEKAKADAAKAENDRLYKLLALQEQQNRRRDNNDNAEKDRAQKDEHFRLTQEGKDKAAQGKADAEAKKFSETKRHNQAMESNSAQSHKGKPVANYGGKDWYSQADYENQVLKDAQELNIPTTEFVKDEVKTPSGYVVQPGVKRNRRISHIRSDIERMRNMPNRNGNGPLQSNIPYDAPSLGSETKKATSSPEVKNGAGESQKKEGKKKTAKSNLMEQWKKEKATK